MMVKYAICEILGKQYQIIPDKPIIVEGLKEGESAKPKVLFIAEDETIAVGRPYLDYPIKLEILKTSKGKKITTRKFHAKANYRKTIGYRPIISEIVMR